MSRLPSSSDTARPLPALSRWAGIACGVLLTACQPAPSAFSPAAQSAVADTIQQSADRFIASLTSLDIARFTEEFTADPDLVYVDNGIIYPDRDALAKAAGGFFTRVRSAAGRWESPRVLPLSPSSGAFTGIFRADMVDTAGTPLWTDGKIWTFVYERRADRWVIVQAHEVNARPAR